MDDASTLGGWDDQERCESILRSLETKLRTLRGSLNGPAAPPDATIPHLLRDIRQLTEIPPFLLEDLSKLYAACRSYLNDEPMDSYQLGLVFLDAPQLLRLLDGHIVSFSLPTRAAATRRPGTPPLKRSIT